MGTPDVAAGPFGLGCVNLGSVSGRGGVRLVHEALDLGIHFFDTADAYGAGNSERVLGRALRQRRDRAFVATKGGYVFRGRTEFEHLARRGVRLASRRFGRSTRATRGSATIFAGSGSYVSQDFSPSHLRQALDASLRRLNTDYVDLYQLHGPRGTCDDDVLALMLDLQTEGKILGFGVGLETLEPAMDWLETGALSSIQLPFGVLDPEAGDEVIPSAMTKGVPVVARGVFASGLLVDGSAGDGPLRPGQPAVRNAVRALASSAGVSPLQIAAWFVNSCPGVTTVLVGSSSARHLAQNLRYIEARPPDGMLRQIEALLVGSGSSGRRNSSEREAGGQ